MIDRTFHILLLTTIASCASGCASVGVTAQVGFTQTEVDGRLALEDTGSGGASAIEQDVGSAFGIGEPAGSPWLRLQADAGGPVVTGSLFWLSSSGRGRLDNAFGGLAAGTEVAGDLDLAVAKLSAAYDLEFGPVKVAPGVLFDVFALDFSASETLLGNREEIDDIVFVPMPFLRTEADLGPVTLVGEAAYLEVSDVGDSSGRFLDLEGIVEVDVAPIGHVFVGYRYLDIDASGETERQAFAADLQIRGWTIGGGIRF